MAKYLVLALLVFSTACGGSRDDEGLDDLELSGATLTPEFDSGIFEYQAEVANEVDSIVVTASVADSGSTLTVNGSPVPSGSASPPLGLTVGENPITLVVTEDDGDTETYTVVVTRLPPPSDNPALASLELTVADLDQIFDGDLTAYTASTGHFGASTRVVAEPEEPRAEMELEGERLDAGEPSAYVPLSVGANTIALTVTAEDGSVERTYEVEITRAEQNTLRQEAYLKASNTGPDEFGASVGISRHTLVVGAPSEGSAATGVGGDETDNFFPDAGAAYVFERSGSTWVQSTYLKASNTGSVDRFGGAVDIDGDLLAVGAAGEQSLATGIDGDEDDDSGNDVGAVYAFERDGMGVWEQTAYVKASNADSADAFGSDLDVDGARIITGAWSEDSDAVGVNGDGDNDVLPGSGAAYVFARDESGWEEEAYLKASNTDGEDEFGRAVALSGRTAAVGAPREDSAATGIGGDETDNSLSSAGAVYLFEADEEGSWAQTAYVKASNTDAGDDFGAALALDGDLLAVGAPGEDSDADGVNGDQDNDFLDGAGAVYVFERDADRVWTQIAYVKASDPGSNDGFGSAVALSGNVLVVGAPGENSGANGLDGDAQDESLPDSGAVYVFERDAGGDWRQLRYVKASNTDSGDELGGSVAFHGDTLLTGAALEDGGDTGVDGDDSDNSVAGAGAAYVVR